MDPAAPLRPEGPSWNPLRVGGRELEPNVLLAAKLIAFCLLATNHLRLFPEEPSLPFLPVLDALRGPFPFEAATKAIFVGSAAALLFNRRVRLSCLLLGGVILLGVLSSKAYYENHNLFCGLFLVLAGMTKKGERPWLPRAQIVLVYLGAALNKWLDPAWRNGGFSDNWAVTTLRHELYMQAAALLPAAMLGKIFAWTTILTETTLAAGFSARRFWGWAIWLGVLFHASMTWFTGSTFTMFLYAMEASFLVFAPWPKGAAAVFYDGDCGFCEKTRRAIEKLDFDGLYDWRRFQEGGGEGYGISREAIGRRLHLVVDSKIYSGFAAFKIMLLYNPVTYFVLAALLTAPGPGPSSFRNIVTALAIAFFFPLFSPIGEAVYDLIARNRHRMPGDKACDAG